MKWHTESNGKWFERMSEWHAWFAWYPVYCRYEEKTIWLETVERRIEGSFLWYCWVYREKKG